MDRVEIVEETGPGFGEVAAAVVAQWKFLRGQVNVRTVSTALKVLMVFDRGQHVITLNSGSVDCDITGPVIAWEAAEVNPVPIFQTRPINPTDLREEGRAGDVGLGRAIHREGYPCWMRAVKAPQGEFGASSVRAVRQWRY